MKGKVYLASLICVATGISANVSQAMPEKCPDAAAIRAVNVSKNVIKINNAWIAGRRNQAYQTNDRWTFVLTNISAGTATSAYNKAKDAIKDLSFQVGPVMTQGNKWLCVYNTKTGYPGYAVTPAVGLRDAVDAAN